MQKFFIKRQGVAALLAAVLFLCTACGEQESSGESDQNTQLQEQQTEQPAENQQSEEQEPEGQATGAPESEEQAPVERPVFSFADVAELEFYFSSGEGAWRTVLYIHADGSFDVV